MYVVWKSRWLRYLRSNRYTDSFKKGSVNLQMFLRRKLIFKRRNGQKSWWEKTPQIFTISPVLTKFFTLNTDGPVQWLKGVKQLICSSPTTFRKNIPGWVVTLFNGTYSTILLTTSGLMLLSTLWQYRLWSFQAGVTKLERHLHKNQHTQRKSLNFENWTSREPQ